MPIDKKGAQKTTTFSDRLGTIAKKIGSESVKSLINPAEYAKNMPKLLWLAYVIALQGAPLITKVFPLTGISKEKLDRGYLIPDKELLRKVPTAFVMKKILQYALPLFSTYVSLGIYTHPSTPQFEQFTLKVDPNSQVMEIFDPLHKGVINPLIEQAVYIGPSLPFAQYISWGDVEVPDKIKTNVLQNPPKLTPEMRESLKRIAQSKENGDLLSDFGLSEIVQNPTEVKLSFDTLEDRLNLKRESIKQTMYLENEQRGNVASAQLQIISDTTLGKTFLYLPKVGVFDQGLGNSDQISLDPRIKPFLVTNSENNQSKQLPFQNLTNLSAEKGSEPVYYSANDQIIGFEVKPDKAEELKQILNGDKKPELLTTSFKSKVLENKLTLQVISLKQLEYTSILVPEEKLQIEANKSNFNVETVEVGGKRYYKFNLYSQLIDILDSEHEIPDSDSKEQLFLNDQTEIIFKNPNSALRLKQILDHSLISNDSSGFEFTVPSLTDAFLTKTESTRLPVDITYDITENTEKFTEKIKDFAKKSNFPYLLSYQSRIPVIPGFRSKIIIHQPKSDENDQFATVKLRNALEGYVDIERNPKNSGLVAVLYTPEENKNMYDLELALNSDTGQVEVRKAELNLNLPDDKNQNHILDPEKIKDQSNVDDILQFIQQLLQKYTKEIIAGVSAVTLSGILITNKLSQVFRSIKELNGEKLSDFESKIEQDEKEMLTRADIIIKKFIIYSRYKDGGFDSNDFKLLLSKFSQDSHNQNALDKFEIKIDDIAKMIQESKASNEPKIYKNMLGFKDYLESKGDSLTFEDCYILRQLNSYINAAESNI